MLFTLGFQPEPFDPALGQNGVPAPQNPFGLQLITSTPHSRFAYGPLPCTCAQALVDRGLNSTPLETKERAYATWLGFYKGFTGKLGWDSAELVQAANYFSTVIGAPACRLARFHAN